MNEKRGTKYIYYYTGGQQSIILDPGTYIFEVYGASGGGVGTSFSHGGPGGYAKGEIFFKTSMQFFIHCGQQGGYGNTYSGNPCPATYNGGGKGVARDGTGMRAGAGGGATDIRLISGAWDNLDGLKSRIIVGGGGRSWFLP